MSSYATISGATFLTTWGGPRVECGCVFATRMSKVGVSYCRHIHELIENRVDANDGASIPPHTIMLELPVCYDSDRQVCYGQSVLLAWEGYAQSFAVELEGEVIGYGNVRTSRREIIDMILPHYVELHYKRPCSRCEAVVPREELLHHDGLELAIFMAASVKHNKGVCAECADLIPQP